MPDTKIKTLLNILIFITALGLSAQTSDLFRIEYLNVPNKNTGNSVERFRTLFQLPLKITEQDYFIVGGEYRYISLELGDVPFTTEDLNSVQRIVGSLGYLRRTKGDWIYAVKAGLRLQSNFDTKLVADDYIHVGNVYAIRDRKDRENGKPDRLIIGLEYTTTPGRNFPLPILNYYREFHPDWTYTLGVPKTNVRYKFDDINHVQAFVTLDNFFANIQGNKMVNGNDKIAENISMTTVLGGLGYEHYFTDHIMYYGYVAYTISNDYRLRDNERNDIYTIEDNNTMYFRTGIKFKI